MAPTIPLLETRHLQVGIGPRSFCQDLALTLNAGEVLAILGRNGVGKSTLLSVLAGLRQPQQGAVCLCGQRYDEIDGRQAARLRGWLTQRQHDAFAASVLETVLVGRHPHANRWGWESAQDEAIALAALASVDLADLAMRDVQMLSGGERQRVAIAALLAQQPRVYLLDEPIAHLDLKHQVAMLDLFVTRAQAKQAGVVTILHDPSLAWRYADQVLLMFGDGVTQYGASRDILTAERLSELYQTPLRQIDTEDSICFIPR